MSLFRFLGHFFVHAALAAGVLLLVLLLIETVVPGSVQPFIDIIDAVAVVFVLLLVAAFVPQERSPHS